MNALLVRGGDVVDPATGRTEPGDVLVVDGRVAARGAGLTAPDGADLLDAEGRTVTPGLLDLQVNGAAGVDLTSTPERLDEVAAALPRHGVTGWLPTIVSGPADRPGRALAALRTAEPLTGATPLGLHLEGPMLAAARRGAHLEAFLRTPSAELVEGWSRAAGVAVVTLAPELPGAVEVIRLLVERGVVVSIGHTEAGTAAVDAAVDAGARLVTHLFNAMPGLEHRRPGPVGTALGGGTLVAGVIVDGLHVDPLVVAAAWRALAPDRFLAVSDTTAALDLPPGRTRLGELDVVVGDGAVRLAAAPDVLAGSAVGLDHCLRTLVAATGCTFAAALRAATTVPAAVLGRADVGHLALGARGDLVVWDDDLSVEATVVAGHRVFDRTADGAVRGLRWASSGQPRGRAGSRRSGGP